MLAQRQVDRIGEQIRPERAVGYAVGALRVAEDDQLAGVGHRQRPEQQCVDEGEHGGIRADTDRERQHDHEGEAQVVAERAHGIPHVLTQLSEVVGALHLLLLPAVDVEQLGADAVPVAELPEGLGAGGRRLHAALHQPSNAHVQVERELRVHVALNAVRSLVQVEVALAGRFGHQPVAGAVARNARPAASTKRCHDELPACRRARPPLARW